LKRNMSSSSSLTEKDKGAKTTLLHHIRSQNSEETSKKSIKLLLQVVANIIKYPNEEKYRKLKADKIYPKIDSAKGFFDIIEIIGFVDLNTHLELPMTADLAPLSQLIGEIEGKPAPKVPNMSACCNSNSNSNSNSSNSGCCKSDACETDDCTGKNGEKQKKSGGCCGGNSIKNENKNSGGCCGGNSNKKSGGNHTHDHSHDHSHDDHSHDHSHDDHSHDHSHDHSNHSHGGHGHSHGKGSSCSGKKNKSGSSSSSVSSSSSSDNQAQSILNQNMAEVEKQQAEKKAEKEKIKQKMAASRKEKNSEITTSSIAKNSKFGATIGTLPKDQKACGNGNGSGGCC